MRRPMRSGPTVDDLLEEWDNDSLPEGSEIDLDPLSGHLPRINENDVNQLQRVYRDKSGIMQYRPTAWDTPKKVVDAIKSVFYVNGTWDDYNDFQADQVIKIIERFPSVKFQFGREYSPVLYAQGSPDDLKNLKKALGRTHTEELDIQDDGTLRAWWD